MRRYTITDIVGLAALLLELATQTAAAFYDPAEQRWINRDPFPDSGFQERSPIKTFQATAENPFALVKNAPIVMIDLWGLEPTFKGCSQKQIDDMKNVLKDYCKKAKECATDCPSSDKAKKGIEQLCDGNQTINCVRDTHKFPDGSGCDSLCGAVRGGEIYMCDRAFRGLKGLCDPEMGCTLFHEGLHLGDLPGNSITPHPPDFKKFEDCMGCPFKLKK